MGMSEDISGRLSGSENVYYVDNKQETTSDPKVSKCEALNGKHIWKI